MQGRKISAVVGLSVVLFLSWPAHAQETPAGASTQPAKPAPRLELSTEEWNFGQKWFGEPCETEVTIKNAGNAPLEIIRVRRSCGCTVAKLPKHKLAPGESLVMKISYNTRKNKPKVSQKITLETNDPVRPRVDINIKGEVRHVYEAKPGYRVSFGRLERDSKVTQTIELTNNMSEPVYLSLSPKSDLGPFSVKFETVEKGRVYKVTVSSKPPLRQGANVGKVVLDTGLPQYPELEIPISAYVAPRVDVMPKRLFVSPRVTREFQRIVRVTYRPNRPIKIVSIKTSHPDLIKAEQVETPAAQAGNALTRFYRIRVTLPPGDKMPKEGGWIEIETDDPSPEYHKLRVQVVLRPNAGRVIRPMPGRPGGLPQGIKRHTGKAGQDGPVNPPSKQQKPAGKRGQPE